MSDRLMRQPLLDDDPAVESLTSAQLQALVMAIEQQRTEHREHLAAVMERRGEAATATALRTLLARQREHLHSVQQRFAHAPARHPDGEAARLVPPTSLDAHWDEFARSALLTPYRVYALAVESARRTFAYYSYLSARAEDPHVQADIDALAAGELQYAAALRQLRRRAWRNERRPMRLPDLTVGSTRALREVMTEHEAAIAARLGAIAILLRRLGDAESATLLDRVAHPAGWKPDDLQRGFGDGALPGLDEDHVVRGHDPISEGGEDARSLVAGWASSGPDDPVDEAATAGQLLTRAQKPLEAYSETLESILRTSEGALFQQAAAAMQDVTARLAEVARQAELRLRDEALDPHPMAGG